MPIAPQSTDTAIYQRLFEFLQFVEIAPQSTDTAIYHRRLFEFLQFVVVGIMLLLFWFALLLSGAPDHGRAGAPSPPAAGPSAYLRENFEQGDASFPSGWTTSRAIPEGDRGRFAVAVNPLVPGKLDHGLRRRIHRGRRRQPPSQPPAAQSRRTLVVQFSVRLSKRKYVRRLR